MATLKSICLFCGSNSGVKAEYARAAYDFGRTLAENNIRLIYGGGNIGLMGIAADAALEHGGEVVGVIPEFLKAKEVAHNKVSELIVTKTMHERKAMMANLSDGFIALPGGFGTLDELFEILTWAQLAIHSKPVGLLNTAGFFNPMLDMTKHMVEQGFARKENLALFSSDDDIRALINKMQNYEPEYTPKWLDFSAT